jgi:hypothetical protein
MKTNISKSNVKNYTKSEIKECIVLHLFKSLFIQSKVWTPGCEWWDRVFDGDEAIDTATCTINTDITQLPSEARYRADKEVNRFNNLSEIERDMEMKQLANMKKVLYAKMQMFFKVI